MVKNYFAIIILPLFILSGCTQQPARVELKGSQNYSRSGYSGYGSGSSSNSTPSITVSESTEQSAAVESIGISDLSPPSSEEKVKKNDSSIKSEHLSETLSAPKTLSTPEQHNKNPDGTKTTINPWTNKPRSENEQELNFDDLILGISLTKSLEPVK